MLVLTRYAGESILLDGGRIRLMVVSVNRDGRVRLGFDTSPEVDIVREEIAEEWQANRRGPSPIGSAGRSSERGGAAASPDPG